MPSNPEASTPQITLSELVRSPTVEGFETLYGAPGMGLQWHPETYLPGMPGEKQGSPEINTGSRRLFRAMAEAAASSKRRRMELTSKIGKADPNEPRAYETLLQVRELMALGKAVGAGNLYREAVSLLPKENWSERMKKLDLELQQDEPRAYGMLQEVQKLAAQGSQVGAANLYRDVIGFLPKDQWSARMRRLDSRL